MAAVQLKFGPADHGRPVTADELAEAEYAEGFRYEVIDGRLFASALPNLPENYLETWLLQKLWAYAAGPLAPAGRVTTKARVFVPGRSGLTAPEPDLALYPDFPIGTPIPELRWQDVSPALVAELLVDSDPEKDLVRNVQLYLQVPSVLEYWVLDGREDAGEPTLTVRRRHRGRWVLTEVPFGESYSSKSFPGFELLVDPRR